MKRFKKIIFKQRDEINDTMAEMFGLLRELILSRTPEKVLVRKEARSPITRCVNTISLIKIEKEKGIKINEVVDKNVIEPNELDAVEPLESVGRKEEMEDIMEDETARNMKEELTKGETKAEELVEMPRGITWDKVENPNPQSTPQVLPSFEEYTPPVTHPEEVEETIGILMEVEPFDETQLEDLGLDTCNHDIPLSFREVPSFDEQKLQPQPLPNCLPLDISL
uniref:Uncharacterized protein n=1 Tax=Tanacetum cinerariifolium TaxID=118510 RepID=A0A6L2LHD6_TANCI|nr:hypothetical protein [Tanacetum cinerariifolium]